MELLLLCQCLYWVLSDYRRGCKFLNLFLKKICSTQKVKHSKCAHGENWANVHNYLRRKGNLDKNGYKHMGS
ncbi:hypothetical protein POVCU1_025630 [Plasmodium ovale curtisi]|uniref:Uncharacterized protein n=1 Tax=Plasmodium ovale curtisi TaxID=864141 RepID=A0A1A8WMI2_PLAOA|nr:hypothetical protein POVCU1_025630 [Plasmodium ovale curtisi]